MSKNVWDLPLDLKFRYSASIPQFRRKDSAVLNIYLFDAKERKDISNFSKATMNIQLPSGKIMTKDANRQGAGMDTYVQYQFTDDVMTEIGLYSLILTVEKDGGRVSTQKFTVYFYDNESNADFEFIDMMQQLQLQINYLDSIMDNIVLKDLIGKSNGLIPLDENGKIPMSYMPTFLQEHINTNIYLTLVHDLMVDANLNLVYKGKGGNLEYVGHKEGSATLSLLTTVDQGVVKLTYYGVGTVTEQRWMAGDKTIADMKVNGTLFTGLEFKISKTGIHTIYYKDLNGREYLHKFNVNIISIPMGEFEPYVVNGQLLLQHSRDYTFLKIARGIRDFTYMKKSTNGVVVTIPHRITESAQYTMYIIDDLGREYIRLFYVSFDDLEQGNTNDPLTIELYPDGYSESKSIAVGVVNVTFGIYKQNGDRAGSSLDYVVLPDKTIIRADYSTTPFSITKNGTYTWRAYNKFGTEYVKTLKVENIGIERNLKDLPVGSKFNIFQSEAVLLKKETDKFLIGVAFGWNYQFSHEFNTSPSPQKNLLPNSTIKDAVFLNNYVDNERQMVNNVKGNFNYQYAILGSDFPYNPTPVGSPIYYESQRGVLDIFTLKDGVEKGYFTVTREEMSSTPLNGTNDRIIMMDSQYSSFGWKNVKDNISITLIGMWMNDKTKVWQKGW